MDKIKLKQALEQLIYESIDQLNDETTDDIMVELMEDYEARSSAIDYLIEILEEVRNG